MYNYAWRRPCRDGYMCRRETLVGQLADDRTKGREYPPGMRAPSGGVYEQRNVLGSFTGVRITVVRDEILPAAPRGFTWSLVAAHSDS
jgi:hypothetical protein